MKKILTIPNPTLREKSKPVTKVDKKLITFVSDLKETLERKRDPKGVGLAAPQINKLWRVFSLNVNGTEVFINPKIIKNSGEITLGSKKEDTFMEGCLSMPKLYGPAPRYTWIEAEYQVIEGEKLVDKKIRLDDFPARVFQHELDHLNGILFTDYAIEYDLPVYKETAKDKFEEVDQSMLELF